MLSLVMLQQQQQQNSGEIKEWVNKDKNGQKTKIKIKMEKNKKWEKNGEIKKI